jgi:hypothetical protein
VTQNGCFVLYTNLVGFFPKSLSLYALVHPGTNKTLAVIG